jgi:putative ABC transport system permease protein
MLGIVIGVAAVIAVVALGTGAQQRVKSRIASLGTTMLQIDATWVSQSGVRLAVRKRMTMDDVQMIEDRAPHVIAVQPQQDKSLQITWKGQNTNLRILGVTSNFPLVRKFEVGTGRMFTPAENRARARVAVLGAGALSELNVPYPQAIIGQLVRIGGIQFTVIGVLKAKGSGGGFGSPDDQVLVPFNTGRFRLFGTKRVDDIFALASSEADIPLAMAEITSAMRRSHRLRPDQPSDFRIRNQSDYLSALGDTTQVFTLLLASIAAVSLLVGGIGIMNIMLVSVTERTREIGVRKALGATRRTILLQFLMEAITLCILGGIVGAAVGAGASELLRRSFGWATQIDPTSMVLAFAFSGAVGIIFGVWPARRAARLDPIEALRYE